MKKPYYTDIERFIFNTDTLTGAQLRLNLAWMKLKRELWRALKK